MPPDFPLLTVEVTSVDSKARGSWSRSSTERSTVCGSGFGCQEGSAGGIDPSPCDLPVLLLAGGQGMGRPDCEELEPDVDPGRYP